MTRSPLIRRIEREGNIVYLHRPRVLPGQVRDEFKHGRLYIVLAILYVALLVALVAVA